MGYFVKPMLPLSKDQIRNYMEMNQFKWMEDDSNASRKYKRNKVRLDLIPLVEELSGGKLALYNRMNDLEAQSTELKSFFENEVCVFF
jgi:tRNA(Ile)-lysidine synthase